MDFRNKHLLGLYITVIYFVGPACAACKTLKDNQIYTTIAQLDPVKKSDIDLKPTIKNIYETFFKGTYLKDRCISKKNFDFWKLVSSDLQIDADGSFTRNYITSDGETRYSMDGKFSLGVDQNFISWFANGGIPGGTQTGTTSGRIYILDVLPHQMSTGTGKGATSPPWSANDPVRADGSTIIYYSCFDGDEIENDNVYIVQTIKMSKLTQENIKTYKEQVKKITILNEANELECY